MRSVLVVIGLVAICGCGGQGPAALPPDIVAAPQGDEGAKAPPAKAPPANPPAAELLEGCRITGRVVSSEWQQAGGGIERAIVSVWKLPDRERLELADGPSAGDQFELHLPPGNYRLDFSATGTRGATFRGKSREVTIAPNQDQLDVGEVDLPISKTTGLYGQPAPELSGVIAWQDTEPLELKDLHGKLVVLDFFGYYCSICHHHKPDLIKLRDKYKDRGVVVLAIHDDSLQTLDEMNAKMQPVLRRVFDGDPPHIPMALDGAEPSVFEAYGIYAVPAVILIDQQGRVFRRYHHAGKPELERDIQALLGDRSA